jgi:hypothetical protein
MNKVEVMLPEGYQDSDVILRVKPPTGPEPTPPKFRSFAIGSFGHNGITVKGKLFPYSTLFDILKNHGMSSTIPMTVTLGPTKFTGFDWNPHAYPGKIVRYFDWNGTQCSIVAPSEGRGIYIRVCDMAPGAGEKVLDELADEIYATWVDPVPVNSFAIYTTNLLHGAFQWQSIGTRQHRKLDTIYINDDVKNTLVQELKEFYDSADFFDEFGVTWKRVHLFHGAPGTGKTSMVMALASMYGKNIAKLTITPQVNSQHVETLFRTLPPNTVLLLEDADALFKERDAESGIDFSTLLNCMDGIATVRGLVVFMTTNHLDKLDAAFTRDGRVDSSTCFGLPTRDEIKMALTKFAADFAHEHEAYLDNKAVDTTIAGVQAHIFRRILGKKGTIL